MNGLSEFPITKRWPPMRSDMLQHYSLPSSNGVKDSIMLEEIGLPYEAHRIDIGKGESRGEQFLTLDPDGKIPAIIDPHGPGDKPFGLAESCPILVYLPEKTGQFLTTDAALRYATLQWVV